MLWLLAALFAWLAIDALRTHGYRTPSFRPTDTGAPPHENLTKPVISRSGRALAVVFAILSAACLGVAFLHGEQ